MSDSKVAEREAFEKWWNGEEPPYVDLSVSNAGTYGKDYGWAAWLARASIPPAGHGEAVVTALLASLIASIRRNAPHAMTLAILADSKIEQAPPPSATKLEPPAPPLKVGDLFDRAQKNARAMCDTIGVSADDAVGFVLACLSIVDRPPTKEELEYAKTLAPPPSHPVEPSEPAFSYVDDEYGRMAKDVVVDALQKRAEKSSKPKPSEPACPACYSDDRKRHDTVGGATHGVDDGMPCFDPWHDQPAKPKPSEPARREARVAAGAWDREQTAKALEDIADFHNGQPHTGATLMAREAFKEAARIVRGPGCSTIASATVSQVGIANEKAIRGCDTSAPAESARERVFNAAVAFVKHRQVSDMKGDWYEKDGDLLNELHNAVDALGADGAAQ